MKIPPTEKPESRFLPNGLFGEDLSLYIINTKRYRNKAVFLDRDGTINVERGYLLSPSDIELNPTVGEAISTLNNLDVLTIVITNQAAIDKELLSFKQFERINEKLWGDLLNLGARYDALYFCPHSPEITPGCSCRKPKPGLLLQASQDFNINLPHSFMIGDKLSDIEAGQACGCRTILVLTGRGEIAYNKLKDNTNASPDFVADNLGEAVKWICNNIKNR